MQKFLLDNLELELLKLENKVRFILGVVKGEIIVRNRKRAELFIELQDKGFTPFPKKTKNVDAAVAGVIDDAEENDKARTWLALKEYEPVITSTFYQWKLEPWLIEE